MIKTNCRVVFFLLATALTLSLLAGCATQNGNPPEQPGQAGDEPVTIMLAAAASLEHVFVSDIIPLFEQRYDWITVIGTYASSGSLQTQIEAGLEADIFMSAAMRQMDALADSGLVDPGSVVRLLENQIVLIAPTGAVSPIAGFSDVVNAEIIAIGDPDSVPAGQYAREVFTYFGIWDEVLQRASLGTNVTQVLHWVAEGGAEVGVAYETDAALTDQVEIIAIAPPESLSSPVTYPVGIVSSSTNREAAGLFLDFLRSDEALAVFERHGFSRAS